MLCYVLLEINQHIKIMNLSKYTTTSKYVLFVLFIICLDWLLPGLRIVDGWCAISICVHDRKQFSPLFEMIFTQRCHCICIYIWWKFNFPFLNIQRQLCLTFKTGWIKKVEKKTQQQLLTASETMWRACELLT